jgi:hypothetical protein
MMMMMILCVSAMNMFAWTQMLYKQITVCNPERVPFNIMDLNQAYGAQGP